MKTIERNTVCGLKERFIVCIEVFYIRNKGADLIASLKFYDYSPCRGDLL
jgi:hypothetical protein